MPKLNVGDQAPEIESVDQEGDKVSLSALRGKRVIIYFYPRDDTPGCTTQACGFRDSYPEIEEKNAIVLGVSGDTAKSHQKFREKYSLPFPLLPDTDHSIAEAFGVWQEKSNYGKKYMGIVRSHFVIDEEGKVVEAKYNVKAKDSPVLSLKALG